ncbi:MAG: RagB/SusD family nutrient uptake outer membrane protein [Bacteroidales bacterium]|jgi:hypothetical protein|nr:RagB/SusD family nutrient uptake outer membrane protein [Bacteroidales bacterium]MCI2133746.1 RagB/SusD family nutrient uptake outer membrane protein [Bacteroidales bacterium]
MKKIIALLATCSCLITSCDFLDEEPIGLISQEYAKKEEGLESLILSVYQNNRYLVDRLVRFADAGTDLTTWATNGNGDRYQDNVIYNDPLVISNTYNSSYWKYLYKGLNIANLGIAYLEQTSFSSETKKNQISSEVHALRAFYLFMIVETWGPASHFADTPSTGVITEGYQPGIAKFYNRILEDLDDAFMYLDVPKNVQWGRMNIGVAKALKMRVLMQLAAYDDPIISEVGYTKEKCYEDAISLCNSLISDYSYKLLDDYASVFDVNNQINDEIIWSIQYTSDLIYNGMTNNEDANHLHRYFVGWYNKPCSNTNINIPGLFSHSRVYGREWRLIIPSLYWIQVFNKYDKRRDATFQSVWCRIPDNWNNDPDYSDTVLIRSLEVVDDAFIKGYTDRGIYVDKLSDIYDISTGMPTINGRSCCHTMRKFLDPSRDAAKREQGFKDVILMRLGEVYITLAEAYVRTDQPAKAVEVITKLRKRALMPGHENELKVSASDMTIDFILEEGARELGGELNRWYMLKRSGKMVEWVKAHNPDISLIKPYHIYRPLPQDALYEVTNLDEFVQNEGYK